MKKQHFLSLFFCLLVIRGPSLQAQQEFAPIGAKWQFEEANCTVWGPGDVIGTIVVEVMRDSVVLGYDAKVLEINYINECNGNTEPQTVIVRQSGEQIFHFLNNEFYLLYDFSAQAGDTIWHQTASFEHKDPLNKVFDENFEQFCSIVDSVSFVEINGEVLKQQYLSPCTIAENHYSLAAFDKGGWGVIPNVAVEKIGALGGLFGQRSLQYIGSDITYLHLNCYEDANFNTQDFWYNDCFGTAINELKPFVENDIQMLTSRNTLFIEGIKKANTAIFLYDINGKLQATYYADISNYSISTKHLKTGLYIIDIPAYDFSQTIFKF